ncbi:VacJ family lipoprotein [Roseomonas terrae]|uniref:VacJ family lipoprotein n=1 Tax=Neoroseomonas terrae TaxID=424799 RepID=A0ABS5EEP1_9PROT|nr:MlaA family lipoprotein [Neoroseomonas terrae]MBR0649430.1 VacJ family lipoprotein [Neoroseomonas terrae]
MRALRRALLLLLLTTPLPALADEASSWRERFNRTMFALNHDIEAAAQVAIDAVPEVLHLPEPVQAGLLNMLNTTVNEPISALGHAITGRYDLAGRQMRRVGINLVAGYGGYVDRATDYGVLVPMIDLGTALCVRGVEAGPFFVLPVIGPRTTRDGLADLGAANIAIYAMAVPFVGAVPSVTMFIVIEAISEVAALAMARNFDPVQPTGTEYEAVRDAYLDHRTRLCEAARGG